MSHCHKVRYRDRIAAELALARIKRKDHRQVKEEKRVYSCPGCRAWHLTSQPKRSLARQERATA